MPKNDNATRTFSFDEISEISRQARLELARRAAKRKDILEWGKCLFPDKFSLPFCQEMHGYFIQIRHYVFTNTEAPRNHAKTTIKCFLIPLFQALEEPKLFNHYLNVQSTHTKALKVNASIKTELEINPDIREIYGDMMGPDWAEQQFALTNGVAFTAIGAGQSIRGINYMNRRPDYIIVDDLYDEEDINNPENVERKNDWFMGSLYPARAKSKQNCVHLQGTAINEYDLLEKLKRDVKIKSRTFKAIKDMTKKEVLWPELNNYESLMTDMVLMGSVIFFREMQNERRDNKTAIIKRHWIKEYDPKELRFHKHYLYAGTVLGVDPSIGSKMENDFTGIALIRKARYHDGRGIDFYIERVWNEHLSLDERIRLLQSIGDEQKDQWSIGRAYIEGISGFKDFVAEVKRRTTLPVREVDQVKDKITTLENKSHFFENGHVYISKEIEPGLREQLIHQLTTNHPKNDDMRDAVLLSMEKDVSWDFI